MKIAIIGPGAMGMLYGAKLSQAAERLGMSVPTNQLMVRLVHVMEGKM